jgi:hypothetical protein
MEIYRAYLSCKILAEALLKADTLSTYPKAAGSVQYHLEQARKELATLSELMAALTVNEPA